MQVSNSYLWGSYSQYFLIRQFCPSVFVFLAKIFFLSGLRFLPASVLPLAGTVPCWVISLTH